MLNWWHGICYKTRKQPEMIFSKQSIFVTSVHKIGFEHKIIGLEIDMRIDEQEFQIDKISWLSFKKLDTYFSNPDSKIEDIYDISTEQFTKDLDTIIKFSKKKQGLYGKFGEASIVTDSNPIKMEEVDDLEHHVQKDETLMSRLNKILNRFFKHESHPTVSPNKIKIKSWNFSNFNGTEKFQVRNLYSIKPVSVTYNSTQQDYKYEKQIISKFCIEESNGKIKELLIMDSMKNGKIKREKYIDDENINRQHYSSEIRNHKLNRCLMKTFLFNQINKHKTSINLQNCIQKHDKTESKFMIAKPISNVICKNRKFAISTPIHTENHNKTQEILEMDIVSISTADDYNDLKPANSYY